MSESKYLSIVPLQMVFVQFPLCLETRERKKATAVENCGKIAHF